MNNRTMPSKRVVAVGVLGALSMIAAFIINMPSQGEVTADSITPESPQATDEASFQELDIDVDTLLADISAQENIAEQTVKNQANPTQTNTLTRKVLGEYLQELRNGTYTQESKDRILREATAYILSMDFTPLTTSEITIHTETDIDSVIVYKDGLHSIMQPLFDIQEYELTTYARAVQENSKEDFDRLIELSALYEEAGKKAKSLPAPEDVSAVHLSIVNNLLKFSVILMELSKGYDDPAASLSGVANFTQAENDFGKAFDDLKTYFILKRVYNTNI